MRKRGMIGMSKTQATRLHRGVTVALAVVALALVADGSVASAAEVHPFISSFSEELPVGLAVDNSSGLSAGDVYVTDLLSSSINKFDASGVLLPPAITGTPEGGPFAGGFTFRAQNAVNAAGDLYVGDTGAGVVDEFGPTGEYIAPQIVLPEGRQPVAEAVDSTGRVLIATSNTVYRYDPETAKLDVFVTEAAGQPFGEVTGVAVDDDPSSPAFGSVYVVDTAAGAVDVFDSSGTSGTYLSRLEGVPGGARRDVVDPATGDVYVTAGEVVAEFTPEGAVIPAQIQLPPGGFAFTVGVNGKTGDVYIGNVEYADIEVYGPLATTPDLNSSATTNLQPTSVTVNGTVDPASGGEVTSCKVEYDTVESGGFAQTAECSPGMPYAGVTEVSANLSGLTPDTLYHFRFVAHNANNIDSHSEEATFETAGPPSISEQSADRITQSTAMLHAHLNAHGIDTHYRFEYGPTTSYGTSVPVPDGDAGAGVTPVEVSAQATGLSLSNSYHYRLVADNGVDPTVFGPDGEFTSRPAAVVEGLSAIAGPSDAKLRVKVEDFGAPSECEVEYVTDAQFISGGYSTPTIAQCTPPGLAGEERELRPVAEISGLHANTTYHYRYLISNKYGETRTADQTFITFGFTAFSFEAREQGSNGHYIQGFEWIETPGLSATQAGTHPFVLDTDITLNTNGKGPAGTVKDVRVHLPAGLIGNPQAVSKCTRYDSERLECAADSEIGLIVVHGAEGDEYSAPLFNIVPSRGVAAEFSARFSKLASAFIVGSVRTGSDYGLNADSLNIATVVAVTGVQVRIWGVPADPSHDEERRCPVGSGKSSYNAPPCETSAPLRPFLTNPTSCTGPLSASVQADTYQAPGEFAQLDTEMPAVTGCDRLHFTPSIAVQPESSAADSPTGLHVDLRVPQNENAAGLAEADLKDATVTLPAGVTVNPSGGGGLTGCSEAQLELHGPNPAACPDSSKVGTVELTSPLVDHPLHGWVYVAQQGNAGTAQGSNPFGSLLAIYIAIDDEETGVVVKLAGKVTLDHVTGQLSTTFAENPQLPFEDLKLDFFGGPRAALATPPVCGSYAASASLASWAEPGAPVAPGVAPFSIGTGPGGDPCPSGGFAPSFTAGTTAAQAGAFAPFVLSFSRQDGEQEIKGIEQTLPRGLLAKLAGVPQCSNTDAAAGACPAASQLGSVTVDAGAGADPIEVHGQIYLTGPYNGGPFGEVVEVPAVAGPLNLDENGQPVTIRGSIRIDPSTAQASVVSDAFPTILQGIPLKVRSVTVTLDRPGFTFNPTNCNSLAVTGKLMGTSGASAQVSAHYQAVNCAKLPFKPKFSVSTQAKASKAGGASLRVKLGPLHEGPQTNGASGSSSSSAGSAGAEEANIARVKVDLPKILPSRLTTLQKACTSATFDANPANCPAASIVGSAVAHTPLLASPVSGPAYFVSHGNEAFPQLVVVLQGEGITVDLVGDTFISKGGITSSTFAHVPDVPVTTFELTLPQGKYSALAANGNLCKNSKKLKMPTEFVAQNGAKIHQSTKISVTGCPKAKKAKHKAKKHKKTRKG